MKRTVLILMVALLGIGTASAQFTKGGKSLSGKLTGLGFNYLSASGIEAINLDLAVAGSYFVADNIAVTAQVGLNSYKLEDITGTSVRFGVGARYYISGGLYGGLGYMGAVGEDSSYSSIGQIEVGYDYYITENVYFEPAVYYNRVLDGGNINELGLSISIGVDF